MSGTASMDSPTISATPKRRALWWPGVALAAAGAAAATLVAAVAHAAGASLEIGGDAIPLLSFAQLAFLFSILGVVLASACRRWAGQPARMSTRTTLVLVAVSFLPDLLIPDADAATRVSLVLTHISVAAIVIPGIRSRLR
ncbi:DUF6069 family protein [Streptomyces sp. NPDC058067]|uniref:DUF6069 family protein n=1 Tax=Streptomyces sp. NPDC058067 TaxID=3346324 RepID=UPI0036EBBE8E